jgi:menaquinone-dependent protoporphyrinogen oxidase
MSVHVVTATRHGSTPEIGEAIARRLRERGWDAVTEDVESADLKAGEPVVLGSPIYMGKWDKGAREIADRLAGEEPKRAIWLFTVGPLGDPPKPEEPGPEQEVQEFARWHAISSRLFEGKLDRSQLNRRERLATRAVKAPEGDFRPWGEIEAWADEIADVLRCRQDEDAQEAAHSRH